MTENQEKKRGKQKKLTREEWLTVERETEGKYKGLPKHWSATTKQKIRPTRYTASRYLEQAISLASTSKLYRKLFWYRPSLAHTLKRQSPEVHRSISIAAKLGKELKVTNLLAEALRNARIK